MRIDVQIDRIVLDGFTYPPEQARRIRSLVTEELTALLARDPDRLLTPRRRVDAELDFAVHDDRALARALAARIVSSLEGEAR